MTGDLFDRFGSESGTYISPVGATADRIASLLGIGDQPNVYAYTNRALPYAGVTDGGVEGNVLRARIYTETYRRNLEVGKADYHQYRVLKNDEISGKACIVAPVFNASGGGIQINLTTPIEQLLSNSVIEEIPITQVPAYFRRKENDMEIDA
jgi:hypothetical protein